MAMEKEKMETIGKVLVAVGIAVVAIGLIVGTVYLIPKEEKPKNFLFRIIVDYTPPTHTYYEPFEDVPSEAGIYRYSQHPLFTHIWQYERVGSIILSPLRTGNVVLPGMKLAGNESVESLENLCVGYPQYSLDPDFLASVVAKVTENNQTVTVYCWKYVGPLPLGGD